ncbi:hypothetical protein ACFL1H_00400 [Nanoarchaeota archaeon]
MSNYNLAGLWGIKPTEQEMKLNIVEIYEHLSKRPVKSFLMYSIIVEIYNSNKNIFKNVSVKPDDINKPEINYNNKNESLDMHYLDKFSYRIKNQLIFEPHIRRSNKFSKNPRASELEPLDKNSKLKKIIESSPNPYQNEFLRQEMVKRFCDFYFSVRSNYLFNYF